MTKLHETKKFRMMLLKEKLGCMCPGYVPGQGEPSQFQRISQYLLDLIFAVDSTPIL
jgi:hypothetical protein